MKREEFKHLLCINTLAKKEDVGYCFDKLAKILFESFHIVKANSIYDFLEIEFYFCNQNHKDEITYPRICESGLWLFHSSGVDITFESDKEHYGGILIRSLVKIDEQQKAKVIAGPQRCEYELFDKIDISGNDMFNIPRLESKRVVDIDCIIQKTKRYIPKAKCHLALNEDYCYYVRKRKGCTSDWQMRDELGKTIYYNAKPWIRQ